MACDVRPLDLDGPPGWSRWIDAGDADLLRAELAGDPRSALVAWQDGEALGALWGASTPTGFRVDGLAVQRDGGRGIAAVLLRELERRSPGQALEACVPVGHDARPAHAALERAGYVEVSREVRVERLLDGVDPAEPDPFVHRSLDEIGPDALVRMMDRCAIGPGFDAEAALARMIHAADASLARDLWSVVELDGAPAGVLLLQPLRYDPGCGAVFYLGVVPEARRRGVGRALHRAALVRLAARGLRRYADATDERNTAMRRIFAADGCIEIGVWRLLRQGEGARHGAPRPSVPRPAPFAGVRPAADPGLGVLRDWLVRHGARLPKLGIEQRVDEERGAYALEAIARGEQILRIPAGVVLTVEDARRSEIGRAILSSGVPADTETLLAAMLLQERRDPASFYRPYVATLPPSFPHDPLSFDDRTLALLEGSLLADRIAERRRALREQHAALVERVPAFARFSEAEHVWARVAVRSRNFGLTIGGARTQALVPWLDLLNHARSAETIWGYDDEEGAVVLTAAAALPAGAPVRDGYGAKSNWRYLLNYGFALDDNEDDEASIRLHLPVGDPFSAAKREALRLARGETSRAFVVPSPVGGEGAAMLAFLRVATADGLDLAVLSAGALGGEPVSVRNEAAALHALARACEEALARFPTCLEEDDRLLRDPALRRNDRNALRVRRGEKRVLHDWLDLCRFASPLLDLPWAALAAMAQRRDAGWGRFDAYVRAGVVPAVTHDPWRALEGAAPRGPRVARVAARPAAAMDASHAGR